MPVLLFETTHHALWAEQVAVEAGLAAELVPAPAGARARCGLALEYFPENEELLTGVLDAAGVPYLRFAA